MIKIHKPIIRGFFVFILAVIILSGSENSGYQKTAESYQVTLSTDFSYDSATVYFAMTDRFYDGNPDNNSSYGRVQEDAPGKNIATFHENNPQLPGASFEEDFFFLGEVWGHGLNRNYYYDRDFDALINFTFQGERRDGPAYFLDRMPRIFENYSEAINEVEDFTVLSYLSQHDTSLYPRERLEDGGTYLNQRVNQRGRRCLSHIDTNTNLLFES